jgi:transcriptional regulator with PAS, ATPase and Fis domain
VIKSFPKIKGEQMKVNWIEEFPAAITVCDKNGIVLAMNEESVLSFAKDGGSELIGKNLFDCHKPESVIKIKELMNDNKANAYTIEKNGIHKFIYQAPWFENGELKGLVEFTTEIPSDMQHHIRS